MSPRRPIRNSRPWLGMLAAVLVLGVLLALEYVADPEPVFDSGAGAVHGGEASSSSALDFLPREAHATLELIDRGGPYPYRQDGTVFQNREGLLPSRSRGYYREFTVDTPGLRHRGARRIVTGGQPPSEWYYTDDHYQSFRAFQRETGR